MGGKAGKPPLQGSKGAPWEGGEDAHATLSTRRLGHSTRLQKAQAVTNGPCLRAPNVPPPSPRAHTRELRTGENKKIKTLTWRPLAKELAELGALAPKLGKAESALRGEEAGAGERGGKGVVWHFGRVSGASLEP